MTTFGGAGLYVANITQVQIDSVAKTCGYIFFAASLFLTCILTAQTVIYRRRNQKRKDAGDA